MKTKHVPLQDLKKGDKFFLCGISFTYSRESNYPELVCCTLADKFVYLSKSMLVDVEVEEESVDYLQEKFYASQKGKDLMKHVADAIRGGRLYGESVSVGYSDGDFPGVRTYKDVNNTDQHLIDSCSKYCWPVFLTKAKRGMYTQPPFSCQWQEDHPGTVKCRTQCRDCAGSQSV